MKAEYTAEDLKGAKRNPFYEKLIKEVLIPVRREDYSVFEEVARANNETPESVIKRCLKMAAKEMKEHD